MFFSKKKKKIYIVKLTNRANHSLLGEMVPLHNQVATRLKEEGFELHGQQQ